mgnify:CR=1 FL=1
MLQRGQRAIKDAELLILVVDGREGLVPADVEIAEVVRKANIPTLLAINKTDDRRSRAGVMELYQLGFDPAFEVSAEHGEGIGELLDAITERTAHVGSGDEETAHEQSELAVAIVGRPNAGKSSLVNRLLREERMLVSDMPGTTRDAVDTLLTWHRRTFRIVDTAGIRRKKKVEETIEKFSIVKALQALDLSDAVIVMIDGSEGITDQDLSLIGLILNSGRALTIAINKRDLLNEEDLENLDRQIKRKLKFVSYADIEFISAKDGTGIKESLKLAMNAADNAMQSVATSELSKLIDGLMETDPPPYVQGRRIKLKYAHQGGVQPPTFIIYGNQTKKLRDNYKRFIEGQIRTRFSLLGTPIKLFFKDSKNPYSGRKNKLSSRQWKKRRRIIRLRKKRS